MATATATGLRAPDPNTSLHEYMSTSRRTHLHVYVYVDVSRPCPPSTLEASTPFSRAFHLPIRKSNQAKPRPPPAPRPVRTPLAPNSKTQYVTGERAATPTPTRLPNAHVHVPGRGRLAETHTCSLFNWRVAGNAHVQPSQPFSTYPAPSRRRTTAS